MKFFVSSKISVMLVGFCAALLVGAGSAEADFILGTPTNLGPVVNSSADEHPGGMTADGLTLYFSSRRSGGYSEWFDIWTTTRSTKNDPWEEPVNLGPAVNTSGSDWEPDITPDGLILVFVRVGSEYPDYDIWMSTRPTTNDPWGTAINLGSTVNSLVAEGGPCISVDGLTIFFESTRVGGLGRDVWMTTRPTIDDPWSEPVNLGQPVNSSSTDCEPHISTDGRTLFFSSSRSGGLGGKDLWVTRRRTINDPWRELVNLGPVVNSSGDDGRASISADERLLLFKSNRPGGLGSDDIWQAPIIPIVDLNGDGFIDSADMCIMVDYWGTDEQLCDIGPTPLGDGIVDVQDLIVLSEYLFKEIYPVELVAYWKLDEAEGDIAYNSIGDNHGILSGNPTWQPDSGQVAGALEFDGINDYVETDFVLNPTNGAFSAFAWIKGGAPGQVIIAQTDGIGTGETWLGADTLDGKLMTGLRPPAGRSPTPPMVSDFVITDGQWHHVGIVVTAYGVRNLYADGMRVASDTQGVELPSSDGGLYFGAGETLDTASFFSGLIDDARIYNIALSAEEVAELAR